MTVDHPLYARTRDGRLSTELLHRVQPHHIHAAVNSLVANPLAIAPFGPSTDYDLVVRDALRLPPKAVFGIAATDALGFPVLPKHFTGGIGTPCFNALEAAGYEIQPKLRLSSLEALSPTTWAEVTSVVDGHGGSGWELGTCLWSPAAGPQGQDFYAFMRAVSSGDEVLHLVTGVLADAPHERVFAGISRVKSSASITKVEPPRPGNWAGRGRYFRIELEDFRPFTPPPPMSQIEDALLPFIRDELAQRPKWFPYATYREGIRVAQGLYLGRCTEPLTRALLAAVGLSDRPRTPSEQGLPIGANGDDDQGPSRGPAPSFGTSTSVREDGETILYLMTLNGPAEHLLPGKNLLERSVVKIGRSNDVRRRAQELNDGFPPASALKWEVAYVVRFATANEAHDAEQRLLGMLANEGKSIGREFAIIRNRDLPTVLARAKRDLS